MVGAHRFVTAEQLGYHFGLEGDHLNGVMARLCAGGFLRRERSGLAGDELLRITQAGLAGAGSQLTAARFGLDDVRRDLAAVWVWIAAWGGAFGDVARVLSSRETAGLDRAAARSAGAPSGFLLQMAGSDVYPDLALVSSAQYRIVVHLSLWPHRTPDLASLLDGYQRQDELVDAVILLIDTAQGRQDAADIVKRSSLADRVYIRGALTGAVGLPAGP